MKNKKKKFLYTAAVAAGLLVLSLTGAMWAYGAWEQPPAPAPATAAPAPRTVVREEAAPAETASPWPEGRKEGVYTLLLVGSDDGNGNTDTILLGRMDTAAHTLDLVNIPRDTLINWDWSIRKINAVYWSYRLQGDTGIDQLKEQVAKLTGFEPDCYAVLDIGVVVRVVDALGGVDFELPMDLNYDDDSQDLHIHIPAGLQHLDGEQAMGVCRYRSGYYNGDLGRIEMQQRFLRACAEQFIRLGNIPELPQVVDILSEGLDTDLSRANLAFFLRQALLCQPEDVRFATMPVTDDTIRGLSYTVVLPEEWLAMVNERLNPYTEDIQAGDLDLVYRENGAYRATGELAGAWYFNWRPPVSSTPAPQEPEESVPTPEAAPEPTPFQLPEFTFPPLPGEEEAPQPEELLPVEGG